MRATALALAASLLSGCFVTHDYWLAAPEAARLATARPDEALAATRVAPKDGATVAVRAGAIVPGSGGPADAGGRVRVRTRVYSPMITAGSLLTWIGSAVSIAGNVLFFVGLGPRDTLFTVGLAVSPSAEPLMIVGTVLWILGTRRHPELAR